MPNYMFLNLLPSILLLFIQAAIGVFYVVLAVNNPSAFKKNWKHGLRIGVVLFLMLLPGIIFNIIHFDPTALFRYNTIAYPTSSFFAFIKIGMLIGIAIQILRIGWYMVLFVLNESEWNKVKSLHPHHASLYQPPRWITMVAAFIFGVCAGVVSMAVFSSLGITEGILLKNLKYLFPTAATSSVAVQIPVMLLLVSSIAIIEEYTFRGGMLAFLLSKSQHNRIKTIVSISAVSLLWALLHLENTSAPLIKITQVFVLGIFFAEFARRGCLEHAIAAHIGLNISCVIIEWLPLL